MLQPINNNANNVPRFGSSPADRSLGERFFTMHPRFERYMDKHWINNPSVTQGGKTLGGMLKWFGGKWLDHDYVDLKGIPALGVSRNIVMPPIGAVAVIVILTTLAARLFYAHKRSGNHDRREIGDIVRRDVPTLGLLVFAQEPLINGLTKILQERSGIQLLADRVKKKQSFWQNMLDNMGQRELTYSELDRYYRLTHHKRLHNMLANKLNHRGILNVIDQHAKLNMNQEEARLYRQFSSLIRQGVELAQRKKLDNTLSQKAFQTFELFEKASIRSKSPINLRNMFANYAKNARNRSVFVSLAIIVGLLGYGVTRFNEWWSIYQYHKVLRQQRH